MTSEATRARADAAALMTEALTGLAKEITRGANDTIVHLNTSLLSQQRVVENYQELLVEANKTIAAQQDEIARLKSSNVESRKLELDFELKRAELAMKEQRIQGLIKTLSDAGGVLVGQYMSARAAARLPAAETPSRPIEAVIADIWPRLSEETVERLKTEAGTDLVFELLTRVTEHVQNVSNEESRH
jgi:hypothetical protein